jgi:hypothetical protein
MVGLPKENGAVRDYDGRAQECQPKILTYNAAVRFG